MILGQDFYNRETLTVAKDLLGKTLVHIVDGKKTSGKIVEVEGYKGLMDKAAHSYKKRTKRVEVMYGEAGFAYVYLIYGMYYCMNVVTDKVDVPEAVLVRAIEPIEGLDIIANRRFNKNYNDLTKKQRYNLTSGPGKLTIALNITKENNGDDLCSSNLYIEDNNKEKFDIIKSKRIGIPYAEEAQDFLWRYYIDGNPYVSK